MENDLEFKLPDDIVVHSTTDSEDEIRAAYTSDVVAPPAADAAAGAEDEDPPAAVAEAVADEDEVVDEPDDENEEPAKAAKPAVAAKPARALTRKEQIQADINKLTREKGDEQRELDRLKAEKAALSAPPAVVVPPAEKPVARVPAAKPLVNDYDDLDLWADAMTTWSKAEAAADLDERLAVRDAAAAKTAGETARVAAVDAFRAQGAALKAVHPDYDEVLAATPATLSAVAEAAILTSARGAEIAYYLASHPDEAAQCLADTQTLGPDALNLVRRQLESLVSVRHDDDDSLQDGAHDDPGPPAPARHTQTPKPIPPVGTGSAASRRPLDKLSADDYVRVMNARDIKRHGRL